MATAASHARATTAPRVETLESRIRRRDATVLTEQRKLYFAGLLPLPCWAEMLYRFVPLDPVSEQDLRVLDTEIMAYARSRYVSQPKQRPSTTCAQEAAVMAGILCWLAEHADSESAAQAAAEAANIAIQYGKKLAGNAITTQPTVAFLLLAEAEFLLRHGTSKGARAKSLSLLWQALTRVSAIQDPVHRAFACRKLGYLLSQHGERWEAFKWSMTAVLTAGIPRLDRWLGVRALFAKGY